MKKGILIIMASLLLAGCQNKYVQQVAGYLKPTPTPSPSASAEADDSEKENTVVEVPVTPDPDAPEANPDPWEGKDGNPPSNAIGIVKILRDNMEVHQYGGIASQVDMHVNAGDTYYVSQIYMDGSGYRWYCLGVDMWLCVTNMEDIDFEAITG